MLAAELTTKINFPCRGRPFWRTLRGLFYLKSYVLPRLGLWLYTIVPPAVYCRLQVPLSWSLPARLAFDFGLITLLVGLAYFLDRMLFAEIFDGREGEPGIRHAPRLAREWRVHWKAVEDFDHRRNGELPGTPATSGLPLYGFRSQDFPGVNFGRLATDDAVKGRLFEGVNRTLVSRLKEISPHAAIGHGGQGVLVIAIPVCEGNTHPQHTTTHVWAFARVMFVGNVLSCRLQSGYSYWFAGGHTIDGTYFLGDLANLGLARYRHVAAWLRAGLYALGFILACFLWPVGIVYLAFKAIRERFAKERYRKFLYAADPRGGDTVDLRVVLDARRTNPQLFPVQPTEQVLGSVEILLNQLRQVVQSSLVEGVNQMAATAEPKDGADIVAAVAAMQALKWQEAPVETSDGSFSTV